MNRLKEIREDRGLRQVDVADIIGVHTTTISKYEIGTSQLTESLIVKFCQYYHVTADYLLGLSDYPNPVVSEMDTELLAAYHAAPAEIRAIVHTALEPYKKEQAADNAAS